MKNIKGGYGYGPINGYGCAPNGSLAYGFALGCCEEMCHEFGVGDICYERDGMKPCTEIMT